MFGTRNTEHVSNYLQWNWRISFIIETCANTNVCFSVNPSDRSKNIAISLVFLFYYLLRRFYSLPLSACLTEFHSYLLQKDYFICVVLTPNLFSNGIFPERLHEHKREREREKVIKTVQSNWNGTVEGSILKFSIPIFRI